MGKLKASSAHSPSPAESPAVRFPPLPTLTNLGLIGLLFGLAIVSWALTDQRMAGMDAGPGTDPGALGFYLITWVVMMAAMMFPSIAPMVLVYSRIQRGKRERGLPVAIGSTLAFVAGYLLTWTAAGLVFYGLLAAVRAPDFGALTWDQEGRYVAGGVIAAAGLYQFTPFKLTCLTKCRDPFLFLLSSWRSGRIAGTARGNGVEIDAADRALLELDRMTRANRAAPRTRRCRARARRWQCGCAWYAFRDRR